ncbi:YeiH family putative sulfate export transporter [Helicobacter didelphidarum]|uniref:YeiH family putative sulfate export transporter n=1 Tax=Helicobacter didelphidarum TaxID=2040648 RepID=A0A3D8IQC3_9HELI|nr:putative sulfate exporter family transporter [Helicobacter didelphidarum]RDU67115.1 YeiH family putative sulfate export transporter [Helicobacter didelphidarum]
MQKKVLYGYLYGVLLTCFLAIVSIVFVKIPQISHYNISPLLVSIIIGVLLSTIYRKNIIKYEKGVAFSAKKILRLGIILYGFNISLLAIMNVGIVGILSSIFIVIIVLGIGVWIGVRFLGLDKDLAILVSGGSAICGAAAILALESSIRADSNKGIIAVGVIVIFGLLGMLVYPLLYVSGLIPFNGTQEGFYIGLTLHEVANVVGAGGAISQESASYALIIKMIRVILLVPVLLIIPFFLTHTTKDTKQQLHIPYFALYFLAVILLHSFFSLPQTLIEILQFTSLICLSIAMVALGLQIDFKKFVNTGGGAFKLGLILFIILSIGGFFFVYCLSKAEFI